MTALTFTLSRTDRIAVGIAIVAGLSMLLEVTLPHRLEAPAPAAPALAVVAESHDDVIEVGPLSAYLSVTERPLFEQSRQPFVAAVEPAPAVPAGPHVEFELTAVIITRATRIALLRSNVTPTVQRVTLNETVDGWTLAEVMPNAVVLRRGTESVTVELRPDSIGPRSGQAARVDPPNRSD
jgi:hypothetical protein